MAFFMHSKSTKDVMLLGISLYDELKLILGSKVLHFSRFEPYRVVKSNGNVTFRGKNVIPM